MDIRAKRVYEQASPDDGYRVLVDRLWPRGISRDKAKIEIWLREIGPSTELRQWFNHDPAKYEEFKIRYEAELTANPALAHMRKIIRDNKTVTLVYSAKDEEHNQAVVLRDYLAAG